MRSQGASEGASSTSAKSSGGTCGFRCACGAPREGVARSTLPKRSWFPGGDERSAG